MKYILGRPEYNAALQHGQTRSTELCFNTFQFFPMENQKLSQIICASHFFYSANLCLNNKEANNYTKPHSLESDLDLPGEYQSNA
jgi:hypothetical protein